MESKLLISLLFLTFFISTVKSQNAVSFSQPGGFYDESFYLTLSCQNTDNQIYYTINGHTPTANSLHYTSPLYLDRVLFSKSDIYKVKISPFDEQFEPDSVKHAIVIRAAAFDNQGVMVSDVKTNTYLIKTLDFDSIKLPVVSICADSLSLFDYDTGLFVPGVYWDSLNPEWTGNYYQSGDEWERLINVEFYEPDGECGFNQKAGLRTHGGNGRRFDQKSIRIYAREKYGKKRFKHQVFETKPNDSFKRLIMKGFVTSWSEAGITDYYTHRLCEVLELNIDVTSTRLITLFLNGEYWGIYTLAEKPDERFLEDNFDTDIDNCNIMGNWVNLLENGSDANFQELRRFMENADLSDETQYEYVSQKIDIECFIDYYCFEIFTANTDWPANNMRMWQEGNGKWRWIFYDGDACLKNVSFKGFDNATYTGPLTWPSSDESTLFFRKLLENEGFKSQFTARFNELLQGKFQYENTSPLLNQTYLMIKDDIENQHDRFDIPTNYDNWENSINHINYFLNARPNFVAEDLGLFTNIEDVTQENSDIYPNPSNGKFNINVESENSEFIDVKIYDSLGRCCYSNVYDNEQNVISIDLRLPSGLYFVSVNGKVSRHIVN